MLIHPRSVRFGPRRWTDVETLAIDRAATSSSFERSDTGPHPVFADVAEQRALVRIVRRLATEELAGPVPGDLARLRFDVAPAGTDGSARRASLDAVVLSVVHDLSPVRPARQTLTLVALSSDGVADPILFSTPSPEGV